MKIETKAIQSIGDFHLVDAIYQRCFGKDSVPTQIQYDWWKKFPPGIIGLYLDEKIVGGLSYWPLGEEGFDLLVNGTIKEKDLTATHLESVQPKGIYISEVAITKTHRSKNLSHHLLSACFEQLKQWQGLPVLALAYSFQGKTLLIKYNFHKIKEANEMPDGQELYILI